MSPVEVSQSDYEFALQTAKMALWQSTINNRKVDEGDVIWTASGATLLGLSHAEVRQPFAAFLDAVHPEDREYVVSSIQQAAAQLGTYSLEYRVAWPDHSIHWVAARARVQGDEKKQPIRTIGVIWDITQRKCLQEKLELSLQAAGMALWESEVANRIVRLSETGSALFGMPGQRFEKSFGAFLEHVHEEDRVRVHDEMEHAIRDCRSYEIEYRVVWPDASVHWIQARGQVYANAHGKPERTRGVICDITEHKQAELAMAEQRELAEVTLSSIGDGITTIDTEGKVRYMNRVAEQLTGWSVEEARGMPVTEVLVELDEATGQPLENIAIRCLQIGRLVGSSSAVAVSRDGRRTGIEASASPILASNGQVLGAVVVIRDVSHERELRHALSWQATHDPLTGLYNRREFDDQLAKVIARTKQHAGEKHALLYLDLDQFKIINDTCGHAAGDEVLRQLTEILQSKMRDSDIFARLGGDEFAVLLIGCSLEQAHYLADELRQAVKDFRFVWGRHLFELGVSIGLMPLDTDTLSASDAMSAADRACYIAKEQGRNKVHTFQLDDLALAERHGEMLWMARLTTAFRQKRLRLYMQPIAAFNGATVKHNEVLLRMLDEEGNLVSPGAFVAAAERFDRIGSIDRWVVENCFRRLHSWQTALMSGNDGLPEDRMQMMYAINLSGASLGDAKLLHFIDKKFEQYQLDPKSICFEITETAVVRNMVQAGYLIQHLKKMGCKFALDDFGSGLSSFSYLKNFPVDYLKIDGGFIRDITKDPVSRAMVESINHVGHVMGIKTIAECVEDDATLRMIREMGLDYAQGYAVGAVQPMH